MNTHNLCFGPKIRQIVYPCIPQFYYVYISRTCFPDVQLLQFFRVMAQILFSNFLLPHMDLIFISGILCLDFQDKARLETFYGDIGRHVRNDRLIAL